MASVNGSLSPELYPLDRAVVFQPNDGCNRVSVMPNIKQHLEFDPVVLSPTKFSKYPHVDFEKNESEFLLECAAQNGLWAPSSYINKRDCLMARITEAQTAFSTIQQDLATFTSAESKENYKMLEQHVTHAAWIEGPVYEAASGITKVHRRVHFHVPYIILCTPIEENGHSQEETIELIMRISLLYRLVASGGPCSTRLEPQWQVELVKENCRGEMCAVVDTYLGDELYLAGHALFNAYINETFTDAQGFHIGWGMLQCRVSGILLVETIESKAEATRQPQHCHRASEARVRWGGVGDGCGGSRGSHHSMPKNEGRMVFEDFPCPWTVLALSYHREYLYYGTKLYKILEHNDRIATYGGV